MDMSMAEGFCIIDVIFDITGKAVDWRYIETNSQFNWGPPDAAGKLASEHYPQTEPYLLDFYGKVALSGAPACIEYELKALKKWYEIFAYKIGSLESRKVGVLLRDITRRKQQEEALNKSEIMHRNLFENMSEMFQILEPIYNNEGSVIDFRYIAVNKATEALAGKKREEIIGRTALELYGIVEDYWFEMLSRALNTHEPVHVIDYSKALDLYYDVNAWNAGEGKVAIVFSNITESKRAEAALRKSEEKYHNLFDSIDEGFCIIEVLFDENEQPIDYRFLEVNKSFERHTGLVGAAGRLMRDMAPNHEQHWFDIYGHIALTGEPARFRDRAEALGFYYDVYAFRVGEPGQRRVAIIFNDITESKKAEEALREKTKELDAANRQKEDILESISDCFYVLDKDLRFTYVNKPAEEIWGLSRADLIGRKIEDVFPGIIDISMSKFHQVLQEKSPTHYEVYSKVIGRWGDMGVYPMLDGISVHFHDITERKRMEEALRESQLQLQAVLKNMTEGVVISDPNGNLVSINDAAFKICWYMDDSKWELNVDEINKSFELYDMDGNLLPEVEWPIARALRGETFTDMELKVKRRDLGDPGIWSYGGTTIRDANSNISLVILTVADITERKRMEEVLRESEQLYRTLFENTDDGFHLMQPIYDDTGSLADLIYLRANPVSAFHTGLAPELITGKRMREIQPDIAPGWFVFYESVLKGDKPVRAEKYNQDLERWFSVLSFKYGNGLIGVLFTDITKRKQAEEALRESEERLQSLVNSIPDEVWFADTNKVVSMVNQTVLREFGQPSYGENIEYLASNLEVFNQDGCPRSVNEAPLLRALNGENIKNLEEFIRTPLNNELRYRQVNASPVKNANGNIIGSVAVIRDITERKRSDEALRKALLREKVLGDITSSLLESEDAQVIMEHICRKSMEYIEGDVFFNYICEEGRLHLNACSGIPAEDAEKIKLLEYGEAVCGCVARDGKRIVASDVQNSPDPRVKLVKSFGIQCYASFPLKSEDHVIGTLSFGSKKSKFFTQDELQFINIISKQITVAMNRVIISRALSESEKKALALVSELEKSDRNKNEFISILSHELRNPLAAIVASLNLLEMSDNKDQGAKAKEIISRQTGQLCKLVDDLLDLTRITQNKINLKKEIVLLNEVVLNIAKDIRPEFEKKGVQLMESIQTHPVFLYVDPVRITQSIGNLLKNALKFTQKEGLVQLTLSRDQNEAVICVKDNGAGIEAGILPHIFEPFIQAENALDRSNGGLGLGLAVVKGIVDLHNGSVSVQSEGAGLGAQFILRLPVSENEISSATKSKVRESTALFKILIIEDNLDLSDILCAVFDQKGNKAIAACNGKEGIAKAREFKPNVIFCDIGLPGMSGYEVAKVLRSDDLFKGVILVAMSGYAAEKDVSIALESGFNFHIAKPISIEKIQWIFNNINKLI